MHLRASALAILTVGFCLLDPIVKCDSNELEGFQTSAFQSQDTRGISFPYPGQDHRLSHPDGRRSEKPARPGYPQHPNTRPRDSGESSSKHPARYQYSYEVRAGGNQKRSHYGYGDSSASKEYKNQGISSAFADFGQQESRDGDRTSGKYFVDLPDGRRQTVEYFVNGPSGYVARVSYNGDGDDNRNNINRFSGERKY